MSFSIVTGAKKVAHGVAVVGGLALTWAFSDKGQQVIGGIVHAYPKTAFITGVLAFLGTVYFNPKAKLPVTQ